MKFDMHCHTKEGSIDSKVPVRRFADMFLERGYDGFMIADHNSYKGCQAWDKIKDEPEYRNLTVIRGIEYDTKDAGHVLIIMPDNLYLKVFKIRGMKAEKVIRLVHDYGGIVGLAHPFGVSSSSAMGFSNMNMELIRRFDFIETFNTCESPESNRLAEELAAKYGLPGLAGSDSHVEDYVGMAATVTERNIKNNNDFIYTVKARESIRAEGTERALTRKAIRKEHWTGRLGYLIYNRGLGKLKCPYRKYHHKKLMNFFPSRILHHKSRA